MVSGARLLPQGGRVQHACGQDQYQRPPETVESASLVVCIRRGWLDQMPVHRSHVGYSPDIAHPPSERVSHCKQSQCIQLPDRHAHLLAL